MKQRAINSYLIAKRPHRKRLERDDKRSDLEAMFDHYYRIYSNGAPEPVSQYKFGRWSIDRAWPDLKIAVELNGGAGGGFGRPIMCHNCGVQVRAKDSLGRPGRPLRIPYPSHSGKGAERDARKANELQAAGWVILTFTSNQLKGDPESVICNILEEMKKRKKTGPLSPEVVRVRLTPRETEIIQLTCEGLSYTEVAYKLGLSRDTVKHHLTHIRDKMGVASTSAAVALAVAQKLVDVSKIAQGPAYYRDGPSLKDV